MVLTQTKLGSFIEQFLNIGSGFVIAYYAWSHILTPAIKNGWLTIDDNMLIVSFFTVLSFVRAYYWRRFFAKGLHLFVTKYVKQLFNKMRNTQ